MEDFSTETSLHKSSINVAQTVYGKLQASRWRKARQYTIRWAGFAGLGYRHECQQVWVVQAMFLRAGCTGAFLFVAECTTGVCLPAQFGWRGWEL